MKAVLLVNNPLTTLEGYRGLGLLGSFKRHLKHISKFYDKIYLLTSDRHKFELVDRVIHVPLGLPSMPKALKILFCYLLGTLKVFSLARHCSFVRADGGTIEVHAILGAKMARKPIVISFRYFNPAYHYGRGLLEDILASLFLVIVKFCLTGSDKVIALTKSLRRIAIQLGVDPSDVIVAPILIREERFNPSAYDKEALKSKYGLRGRKVVLFVGRLSYEKNVDVLIRAFSELVKEHEEARLLLVGGGEDEPKLRELCERLRITNKVIFFGQVPHERVPELLAMADVFVLPSMAEGLPKALLEAMAMKKPIVATLAPGIADVVKPGVEALLVRVGDEEGLARAIKKVLSDAGLAERLAQRARETFEREYSYERLYEKVGPLMRKFITFSFG